MSHPTHTARSGAGQLSIGALARATGIPVETLRTWEQRYGFPVPDRRPSGHRAYAVTIVPRLRRIAELIGRGHRAGRVVPASDAELDRLGAVGLPVTDAGPAAAIPPSGSLDDLMAALSAFDTERVTAMLLADWARLGPLEFLQARAAPLVERVGAEWAAGRLDIRHEHFLSERLGDLLRSVRLSVDRAGGATVVCATLPGEHHGLGLQMAAFVLAQAGWRVVYLGTDVPIAELAAVATDLPASHVAVSISSAAEASAVGRDLARLRKRLPAAVGVIVGGAGAPVQRAGITVVRDLASLHAWAIRERQ